MALKRSLVCALLCLLPGMAVAEDEFTRPGWYLGVGGTYAFHWYPGNYDDDVGATTKTENTGGVNAQAGYRFNTWAAAELEYEWLDGFENLVAGSEVFTLTSHVVTVNGRFLYPGWGRFQPYAVVGVGASIYEVNERAGLGATLDNSGIGFAARIGAGLDVYINEFWLLNVGIDAVIPTTTIDNGNPAGGNLSNLFYIPVQAGLQFRF